MFTYREYQRVQRHVSGDSRTLQSERESSDVNQIVSRYQRSGQLPPNPRGQEPQYGDVTGLQQELTEAYNKAVQDVDRISQEYRQAKRDAQEAALEAKRQKSEPNAPSRYEEPTQSDPAPSGDDS